MATDAAILTAARNYSSAIADLKAADEVVIRLGGELQKAGQIAEEKRKRANECEQALRMLSAQKPSEPPPKPPVGELPPMKEMPSHPPVVTAHAGHANPVPVPNLNRRR